MSITIQDIWESQNINSLYDDFFPLDAQSIKIILSSPNSSLNSSSNSNLSTTLDEISNNKRRVELAKDLLTMKVLDELGTKIVSLPQFEECALKSQKYETLMERVQKYLSPLDIIGKFVIESALVDILYEYYQPNKRLLILMSEDVNNTFRRNAVNPKDSDIMNICDSATLQIIAQFLVPKEGNCFTIYQNFMYFTHEDAIYEQDITTGCITSCIKTARKINCIRRQHEYLYIASGEDLILYDLTKLKIFKKFNVPLLPGFFIDDIIFHQSFVFVMIKAEKSDRRINMILHFTAQKIRMKYINCSRFITDISQGRLYFSDSGSPYFSYIDIDEELLTFNDPMNNTLSEAINESTNMSDDTPRDLFDLQNTLEKTDIPAQSRCHTSLVCGNNIIFTDSAWNKFALCDMKGKVITKYTLPDVKKIRNKDNKLFVSDGKDLSIHEVDGKLVTTLSGVKYFELE